MLEVKGRACRLCHLIKGLEMNTDSGIYVPARLAAQEMDGHRRSLIKDRPLVSLAPLNRHFQEKRAVSPKVRLVGGR